MPLVMGVYGGRVAREGDKRNQQKAEEDRLVERVVSRMKPKLEEEAKKLAAKSPSRSTNPSTSKPLPSTPLHHAFSFMEGLQEQGHQSHPMRRSASFSFADHSPTWGQPLPASSCRFRYHEQPEPSYAPSHWPLPPRAPYVSTSYNTPPPPYPSTYGASEYRATAPSVVISSKPYLHSRYPTGYEHLRTPAGFYPFHPDPNMNGLSCLASRGFEAPRDIMIDFEDYDGFIRIYCP